MNNELYNRVKELIEIYGRAVVAWGSERDRLYGDVEAAKAKLLDAIMSPPPISERDQLAMHAAISLMTVAKLDCPTSFMKKGYELADAIIASREKTPCLEQSKPIDTL